MPELPFSPPPLILLLLLLGMVTTAFMSGVSRDYRGRIFFGLVAVLYFAGLSGECGDSLLRPLSVIVSFGLFVQGLRCRWDLSDSQDPRSGLKSEEEVLAEPGMPIDEHPKVDELRARYGNFDESMAGRAGE